MFELVLKNLYILTTNIAGLAIEKGANVDDLRNHHITLMRNVSTDVLALQTQLTGQVFNSDKLEQGMIKAFEGDLEHGCMGRSAPARLERALQLAKESGAEVPTLKDIASKYL